MNGQAPEPEGLTPVQIFALSLILFGLVLGILHVTGILGLLSLLI